MFITLIVPFSILIPIIIGLLNYKSATVGGKLLLYYLLSSGLINLMALILVGFKMRNLPLLHLYTIIEAVFILSYFRTIFVSPFIKKLLLYTTILFPILCILNFIFLQSIFTFNTYTRPLEAILITFFCMLYIYNSGFTENWINKSTSWFNMGILIYFPVACIIFISSNYLIFVSKDKPMNQIVWIIHAGLVLLMYLFWSRGFYLRKNDR